MARKVLVVDDEKLIVKGIRFSLEQDGMEVDCAYDGEEAVEMAKCKKYDSCPFRFSHIHFFSFPFVPDAHS